MLEAINLSKLYQTDDTSFYALRNVNTKIESGECVAIVGKSGSGKSTLMHILACLDTPSSGSVRYNNEDIAALSESRRDQLRNENFGFIFQQFFLNGRDTVLENVMFPLKIRGVSSGEAKEKAFAVLQSVGLTDKAKKAAKDLSGGEKQRVCVARAVIGEPKVIFADEPTGNLDSQNGALIENLLFALNEKQGIAVVFVTHDLELAARCPRVIELRDGAIVGERRL